MKTPAYLPRSNAFDAPILQGDSYLAADGNAITIDIATADYAGPDPTDADQILLTAELRTDATSRFHIEGEIVAITGGYRITLELDNTDSNQPAGLYKTDIQARWITDDVVTKAKTLIGPDAILEIRDTQTEAADPE